MSIDVGVRRYDGRAVAALAVLTLTSACVRPLPPSLDDDARQYVRLAVALGERDPDSLDFYAGPPDLVADVRRNPPPLADIRRDAAALTARLSRETRVDSAGAARARALGVDLAVLSARVDLLSGIRLPFDQESRAFFGLAPEALDERRLSDIRSQIAEIVGGGGRLVDRYAAFAARFTIPGDRLAAVMSTAVDECRRSTVAHLTLPPDERVRLEFVHNKPWSAYSRYLGGAHSVLQINADFRFTVDQALEVACHEGYPGHHTRNVLRGSAATAQAPEGWAQLTFSPASLVSEASAMEAAGIAFPPVERVRIERDRLFPIAGLPPADVERHVAVERLVGGLQVIQADVARRYLDGELEFVRAVTALESQALVPHAEAAMKYINEYRSYVTTYTAGRAAFAARLAACAASRHGDDARWSCFRDESVR